jgi:hypothetical protein
MFVQRRFIWLLAVLSWSWAPSMAGAPLANIHIFIVSIGKYDAAATFGPLTAADARADDIIAFFRNAYKLPDAQIHLYSDRTKNATERDLRALPQAIQTIAGDDRSVVFLFVMSHGLVVPSNEFPQDLLIVASDTPADAGANQPDRIFGSRFFSRFLGVGEESVIFAFFDTCSAGALSSAGDNFENLFRTRHQRVVAIASSNADQDSYDFAFTRALLSRWREDPVGDDKKCLRADSLQDEIKLPGQEIRAVLKDSEMCLNSINNRNAMLFVLPNSAGPSKMSVLNAASDTILEPRFVQTTDVLPMLARLPRTTVRVQMLDKLGQEVLWRGLPIDLTKTPISFQALRQTNVDPYSPREIGPGLTFGMQSPIGPERKSQ